MKKAVYSFGVLSADTHFGLKNPVCLTSFMIPLKLWLCGRLILLAGELGRFMLQT